MTKYREAEYSCPNFFTFSFGKTSLSVRYLFIQFIIPTHVHVHCSSIVIRNVKRRAKTQNCKSAKERRNLLEPLLIITEVTRYTRSDKQEHIRTTKEITARVCNTRTSSSVVNSRKENPGGKSMVEAHNSTARSGGGWTRLARLPAYKVNAP